MTHLNNEAYVLDILIHLFKIIQTSYSLLLSGSDSVVGIATR